MNFTDIELLLDLRGHLKIVHHVPGRVRLRGGPALYEQASALNGKDLQAVLESVDGIRDIRINPTAASLVIQYDPDCFPTDLWERLIAGSDEEATRLFERVIGENGHARRLSDLGLPTKALVGTLVQMTVERSVRSLVGALL